MILSRSGSNNNNNNKQRFECNAYKLKNNIDVALQA